MLNPSARSLDALESPPGAQGLPQLSLALCGPSPTPALEEWAVSPTLNPASPPTQGPPQPSVLAESHPPETILSRHPFHRHYSLLHSVCQYHPYNTFITSYIKRICVSLRAKTKPCLSFCASFLFTLFS